MSRKNSFGGSIIAVIVGTIIYGIFMLFKGIFEAIGNMFNAYQQKRNAEQNRPLIEQQKLLEEQRNKERQERLRKEREEREQKERTFIEKYKNLTAEEILLREELSEFETIRLLSQLHNYSIDDAKELIKTAERAQKKARLDAVKRKVAQKAQELYGNIPTDDVRKPIPDEVKMFVWQRDGGKCVKCGNNENLEFDHIIPAVKGGSNTERNIQLLCEKCNREKSDSIS